MFGKDLFDKLQLEINKTQNKLNENFMKQINMLMSIVEAHEERFNELERRNDMYTWERGRFTIDDTKFIFEAMVYDKPVKFGIYGGPISFLMIVEDTGSEERLFKYPIVYYDRGWLVEPDGNPTYEKALAHVLEQYNQEGE